MDQPMPNMQATQVPVNAAPPADPVFAFPTGQHNKVHHSYVWLSSLVGVGAAFLVVFFSSLDSIIQNAVFLGENTFVLLGILVISAIGFVVLYGISVGLSALSYKHLSYVFDETEFSLYSGIFTKRRVHVPYARVQSVNHKQSLVQRLAGVCTVEIDTAGGSSNKAIKVPYVKLDTGEAIRADLFARKAFSLALEAGQAVVPGQVAPPVAATPGVNVLDEAALDIGVDNFRGLYGGNFTGLEPVSFERRLDNKELLLASVSHSGISGLVVFMLIALVALIALMTFFGAEVLLYAALFVPMVLGALVFMLAAAMGATALSYGSFSVRRRGSRIEVERGILQRDFSGIDVNRIQSVVIRQSLIRRIIGYCEVSLGRIQAGGAEEQNTQARLNAGGLVVHPFLRIDQVDGLLNGLLPEFADRPTSTQFKGLPAVALRRGMLRRCVWRNSLFWTVIAVAIIHVTFNIFFAGLMADLGSEGQRLVYLVNLICILLYIGFVVQLVFIVVGTFWWKRGSGFAMTEKYLALCNDGLGSETVYLPRQKIQDVYTRTNPFQRSAHVTTIGAVTAAGVQGTTTYLWDVDEEDGQAWLDWLKPRTHAPNPSFQLANN